MQAQQQNYFPDSDTFVELYENIATESQKGQEHFNRWSLTDVTVAGMALLGLLFNT